PLFPPESNEGDLVVAHDDPGVGSIWTSPLAAGWRRLWISRLKSVPSTVGCATSRRTSSRPPPRPFARRWRRILTARECAFPVRCGWSAARLPESAPSLTAFVAVHESAFGTKRTYA